MKGSQLSTTAALLDSAGPGELIQRAAMLDYVADNQVDVLGELEVAKVAQANADSAARAARDEMAAAEEAAEAAKQAGRQPARRPAGRLRAGRDAEGRRTRQQLQAAQIHLLELQGARNAYQQWVAQKQAEEAAARAPRQEAARGRGRGRRSGRSAGRTPPVVASAAAAAAAAVAVAADYVAPTYGRVSSCYGARWGVTHYGVDIAAQIGTPIYAATAVW